MFWHLTQFLVYVLIAGVIGVVVGWAIWARDSRRVRAIHDNTLAAMRRAADGEVSAVKVASEGGVKLNDVVVVNAERATSSDDSDNADDRDDTTDEMNDDEGVVAVLPVVGADIADASVVYVVGDHAEDGRVLPIVEEEIEAIVEAEAIAEAEDIVLVEETTIVDLREADADDINDHIEQAGTKMAEALRAAGITSFAELGAANKADIAAALGASQFSSGSPENETDQKAKDGKDN